MDVAWCNNYLLFKDRLGLSFSAGKEIEMVRYRGAYLPLIFLVFFVLGCAFPKGAPRFEVVTYQDKRTVLDDLKRDWASYSISYGGDSVGLASALIFDPKDDDRRLVGKSYMDVKDKETLERVIATIESYATFTPTVYKIYGPEGEFFGFLFTAFYRPLAEKVDDKTLSLPNWKSQSYIGGP
jgi:hypothetical protein